MYFDNSGGQRVACRVRARCPMRYGETGETEYAVAWLSTFGRVRLASYVLRRVPFFVFMANNERAT